MKWSGFVKFKQFQNVFPPNDKRKLVSQMFRFQLHIILQKKFSSTLQMVGRITYCWSLLILISEEWFPYGSSQHFQGLDIVGVHITDSGNILQSSILRGVRKFTTAQSSLPRSFHWLCLFFYVGHGSWKPEHDMQCYGSCPDFHDLPKPQCSLASDWNWSSVWWTFHQTWDNMRHFLQRMSPSNTGIDSGEIARII